MGEGHCAGLRWLPLMRWLQVQGQGQQRPLARALVPARIVMRLHPVLGLVLQVRQELVLRLSRLARPLEPGRGWRAVKLRVPGLRHLALWPSP